MDGIDLDFTGWGASAWVGTGGVAAQIDTVISDSELHEPFEGVDEPCLRLTASGTVDGEAVSLLVPLSKLLTGRVDDDRIEIEHGDVRLALWRPRFDPEDLGARGFGSSGPEG